MFAFIVVIIILAVIAVTVTIAKIAVDSMAGITAFLLSSLAAIPLAMLGGKLVGIYNDISETEMIGYVANVSYGGIIWKTVEVNVYVDKNTSSVSLAFSSPDREYYEILKSLSGKRIKITSKDSWVQPWSQGDSPRRITSIKEIVEIEKP